MEAKENFRFRLLHQTQLSFYSRFYRSLAEPALVGVEACGNSQWFIELLQQVDTRCR
jgi:hypothetical protein